MKFYDREEETALLERIMKQSREQSRMTVLVGRRRIGKTELAKRCGDSLILYFFVARKAESLLCEDFAQEAEAKLGIPIGHFSSVAALLGYLLQLSEERPFTVIIDEFQDFYRVNPAVFSEIQNQWDRYKDRGHLNLIVSGSIFTMMKHIFEDSKEPLFSRAQKKITVMPFKTSVFKTILMDYNPHYSPDDLLALYAITGGVAWYVTLLMDDGCFDRDAMLGALTNRDSLFINEGHNILIEEFSKEYTTYFSILSCIADGLYSRGEIEARLNMTNLGSYLKRLENDFQLIKRHVPIFEAPNSKKTRYELNDNFLILWFRFFYKYQAMVENDALGQLARIVTRDFEQFSGFCLERYFRQKLRESGRYTRIGGYWNRRGENEIDLVAVNEIDHEADVFEVKRHKSRYDERLLQAKVDVMLKNCKPLHGMKITLGCLSMEDM